MYLLPKNLKGSATPRIFCSHWYGGQESPTFLITAESILNNHSLGFCLVFAYLRHPSTDTWHPVCLVPEISSSAISGTLDQLPWQSLPNSIPVSEHPRWSPFNKVTLRQKANELHWWKDRNRCPNMAGSGTVRDFCSHEGQGELDRKWRPEF